MIKKHLSDRFALASVALVVVFIGLVFVWLYVVDVERPVISLDTVNETLNKAAVHADEGSAFFDEDQFAQGAESFTQARSELQPLLKSYNESPTLTPLDRAVWNFTIHLDSYFVDAIEFANIFKDFEQVLDQMDVAETSTEAKTALLDYDAVVNRFSIVTYETEATLILLDGDAQKLHAFDPERFNNSSKFSDLRASNETETSGDVFAGFAEARAEFKKYIDELERLESSEAKPSFSKPFNTTANVLLVPSKTDETILAYYLDDDMQLYRNDFSTNDSAEKVPQWENLSLFDLPYAYHLRPWDINLHSAHYLPTGELAVLYDTFDPHSTSSIFERGTSYLNYAVWNGTAWTRYRKKIPGGSSYSELHLDANGSPLIVNLGKYRKLKNSNGFTTAEWISVPHLTQLKSGTLVSQAMLTKDAVYSSLWTSAWDSESEQMHFIYRVRPDNQPEWWYGIFKDRELIRDEEFPFLSNELSLNNTSVQFVKGNNGRWHLFAFDSSNHAAETIQLLELLPTGGWNSKSIPIKSPVIALDIDFDTQGRAHVLYVQEKLGEQKLWYYVEGNDNATFLESQSAWKRISSVQLKLDGNDNPFFIYFSEQ